MFNLIQPSTPTDLTERDFVRVREYLAHHVAWNNRSRAQRIDYIQTALSPFTRLQQYPSFASDPLTAADAAIRFLEDIGYIYKHPGRSALGCLIERFYNEEPGKLKEYFAYLIRSYQLIWTPQENYYFHPGLVVPSQVLPSAPFSITVSITRPSNLSQPSLYNPSEILSQAPEIFTQLFVDGAFVSQNPSTFLDIEIKSEVTFNCVSFADVREINVSVDFIYDSQIIGSLSSTIQVDTTREHIITDTVIKKDDSRLLGTLLSEGYVDLTITIKELVSEPGWLYWTFNARHPSLITNGIKTFVRDSREFATSLIEELRAVEFTGVEAIRILEAKGQRITDIVPKEFFEILQKVHDVIGRTPVLLISTNETYLPWELMVLPIPLDPNLSPFLSVQTTIGRWLDHDKIVHPPPTSVEINRCSVVASKYEGDSWQRSLPEALREQEDVRAFFSQIPLQCDTFAARRASLQPLLHSTKYKGHLLHLAVHGFSDPKGNFQCILLEDGSQLPPNAFVGRYNAGDPTTFDFVFLNACYVGTPGTSLGAASGFPGDFVRGGVSGFVAPLWEIPDLQAREVAQSFYEATMNQDQSVAEFLRQRRANASPADLPAAMAYLFYGHPKLRLTSLKAG